MKKDSDEHVEKAWFGLAVYRRNQDGNWVLRLRAGIVFAVLAILAVGIYLSAVFGMYAFQRYYRECEDTSLKDMFFYVIPNRIPFTDITFMPEFLNDRIVLARLTQQEKLGDKIFRDPDKNYMDVLRAANLNPKNLEAQITTARIFLNPQINRIDDAFTTLERSMKYGIRNPAYIQEYARLCFLTNQDKRIIATAEQYLDTPELNPDPATTDPETVKAAAASKINLATSYAEAYFLRGELEKSLKILEKYNLSRTTLAGFLLNAQILWENGEHQRAYNLLNFANQNKRDPKVNVRLLYMMAKFYYEEKRYDDAAQALSLVIIHEPNDFRARIAMLPLLKGEQNRARKADIIETLIKQFGSNENAMLTLGSYAADQGDFELQTRLNKIALENGFEHLANFRLLIVETLFNAGRNADAIAEIGALFTQDPVWLKNRFTQPQFEALRMLAYFADKQNDLGRMTFKKVIENDNVSIDVLVLISRRLIKLGREEEAKALLTKAYIRNNNNTDVLLELVKIDLAGESTTTLSEHLEHLIDSRRPPRYVIENAYAKLASDRFIFTPKREKLLGELTEMLRTRNLPTDDIERKSYLPY